MEVSEGVKKFKNEFRKMTAANVRAVLQRRLEEEAVEASSLSDHTLEDLAAMGHPYRRRMPINTGPHEDHFIHRQTEGNVGFVDSFVSRVYRRGDSVFFKLRNTAPHWKHLKYGTSKMRARPLHRWLSKVAQDEVWPEFVRAQRTAFDRMRQAHFRRP